MARTVTDLALLLDVLAEPDARDWQTLPRPTRSFAAGLDDGVEGLRIAYSPELGYAAVDPEIASLVAKAAFAFAALGAHVELRDPGFEDPRGTFDVLWSSGAARAVAALGDGADIGVDPGLARIAETGRGFSALDYVTAIGERDALAITLSRFHEDWDLLLTPAMPLAAFEAGREVPEDASDPRWPGWTPFTYPFNLTQQPAATVPCGFTSEGLPVGLQIVGPRYADALVLRAARAYEAANPQPVLAPL
jgi:aspartyl-tRNA(Asn)/glutamyl-tRNA(Gln) amidotransferase subunit A